MEVGQRDATLQASKVEKVAASQVSICLSSGSLARMQASQGPEVGPVHSCIPGTQNNAWCIASAQQLFD